MLFCTQFYHRPRPISTRKGTVLPFTCLFGKSCSATSKSSGRQRSQHFAKGTLRWWQHCNLAMSWATEASGKGEGRKGRGFQYSSSSSPAKLLFRGSQRHLLLLSQAASPLPSAFVGRPWPYIGCASFALVRSFGPAGLSIPALLCLLAPCSKLLPPLLTPPQP